MNKHYHFMAVRLIVGPIFALSAMASSLMLFGLVALQPANAKPSETQPAESPPSLSADFTGANLASAVRMGENTFRITIRGDNAAPKQDRWYSFRLNDAKGEETTFRITNAGQTNASGAWRFNRPVVSHDGGETWRRLADTSYEEGVFTFTYTPRSESDWLALAPVYQYRRWCRLLEDIRDHPRVANIEVLVKSLDGNPVHELTIANSDVPEQKKDTVWVVGRQHPAETAGSWMIEGLIGFLLSDDPQAEALLEQCSFRIIGFLNPDGVIRGNYRTNSAGLNLNRQWHETDEQAPTIIAAMERIRAWQRKHEDVIFFVDMHAHSTIRQNFFFYNSEKIISPQMREKLFDFMDVFKRINPDFRGESDHGAGKDDPRRARHWGSRTLDTQSVTFEAAYQDIGYGPNAGEYMTVDRYKRLGSGFGRAIAAYFYDIAAK